MILILAVLFVVAAAVILAVSLAAALLPFVLAGIGVLLVAAVISTVVSWPRIRASAQRQRAQRAAMPDWYKAGWKPGQKPKGK